MLSASGGGGGGTDDQTAAEVPVTATGFTGNLGSADDDVQAALDTIDDFDLEDSFKGPWNNSTTYRGGQSVVHNGLEYISLIDGNTREPTHSEEQWSGQPRGYIFRGDAPVAATTYQESHIVRIPAQDSHYICTFQGGVSVTRAQIAAGHANFAPFAHQLTDAQVGNGSSAEKGTISGSQLDDFAPELGIAEATSKVSDEFGRVSGRRIGEAIDAHVVPSTNATTDISTASAIGTSLELSRDDHEHELPIDNTLEFNASDELSVNVQDVIEHLQERIQYHTNSGNYSSDAGATVGQAYATSQYRKTITKVEVLLNPLVGADGYLVRLDELNADNSIKAKLFTSQTRSAPFGLGVSARAFNFHDADGDVGVTIDGSIRLGILISRLGDNSDSAVAAIHGTEVSSSPRESYDDASTDFDLENDVVYQHIDPAIGASTHSHGTDIRGNIKIFYTVIIDHGNLVGDGQVNSDHIDSGSADDGDVLTADGSGGAAFEAPTGGGGGGGTDDQTAAEVSVDTTNFSRNLTTADDSVQDALETIDGFTQYQGAWQQASWPAGVIVTRSGIAYLSLVNNNTEIPTPSAEGWSGLPEGYIYRGEAPVAATVYNYGHIVFSPDTDNYYFFTSTISASVARADIPTHANFAPVTHKLTNAEATDDLSTVFGAVTGELLASAVAANEDVANSAALVYTQNTRNLALTVGRTIGASLSTQVVIPALTQAQAEDDASTVPGFVTGAATVSGSGGGRRRWWRRRRIDGSHCPSGRGDVLAGCGPQLRLHRGYSGPTPSDVRDRGHRHGLRHHAV